MNFGLVCKKIGMVQRNCDGDFVPLTLLHVEDPVVVGFKTLDRDGYSALIVGFGLGKLKSWNKQQHYIAKLGDRVFSSVKEFRVDNISDFEVGKEIKVSDFFALNELVDVQGRTLGKGFCGPMKRWGFSGLPASHGVSKAHRSHGSTGGRDQARVFKGKKMAGRYGNEKITVKSLKIRYIDQKPEFIKHGSLVGVYGAVPGHKGSSCILYKSPRGSS